MAAHQGAAPGHPGVVIVGGGHAGVQAADSLRAGGYAGPVTIVAAEPGLPYQRPPLSKDHLAGGPGAEPLPLRGAAFYAEKGIGLLAGTAVVGIDRARRAVALAPAGDDGGAGIRELPYRHLVLATGARNRRLSCPGADLPGVHGLRTLADAEALAARLGAARDVVVVGAGFIGLEFAAAARKAGARVTVLEAAPRPLGRAVTATTGEWFAAAHRAAGADLRCGEGIDRFEAGPDGRVAAAVSTTGERHAADLAVVGVGVVPNQELAEAAGLEVAGGIVVDGDLRTSDPAVLAIGDCAAFPSAHAGARLRLESVQNATDQARHAAAVVLADAGLGPAPQAAYAELPWFWSHQGGNRLQIAGLSAPGDETVVTGDPDGGRFGVLCYRGGRLAAVESVNQPAEHLAARRLLAAGATPGREEAAAAGFSLKAWAAAARTPAAI